MSRQPVSHAEFRARIGQVVARSGLTPAAFARNAGIDRSTLSQLLAGPMPRLPRAETLAAVARAAHVSVDWLLGLSAREEPGAEIIEAVLQVEPYGRLPASETFLAWLAESLGSRVCTVPIGIPDFLKIEEVLAADYPPTPQRPASVVTESVRRRLDLMRHPQHQLELCVPAEALRDLVLGLGRAGALPAETRRRQLAHMAALAEELYPAVRLHLYDSAASFSAHYTVFGARRVALFLGTSWLVLNAADHIRMFTRRFGELVRQAVVQPHEVARHALSLREEVR